MGGIQGSRSITRNEVLAFTPVPRPLFHPFSDADDLGEIQLRCYALEEVMSEKVRAVLGQRIYAVSRDLYDIFSLLEHVDGRKVQASLPRKLDAREVDLEAIHLRRMTDAAQTTRTARVVRHFGPKVADKRTEDDLNREK